jgi:hypothetical protein
MSTKWIYEKVSDDRSPRFVLGEQGKTPLVCFGINPSTAVPEKLDRTLASVRNYSRPQFDGWIMLNVYPQRATNPKDLHTVMDENIHRQNVRHIRKIFTTYSNPTVWAAWGGIIEIRPYLKRCLKDIVKVLPPDTRWMRRGSLSKGRHPHHPLYLKKEFGFEVFDMTGYLKGLG